MSYRPEGWVNPYKISREEVDKRYPNGIPRGYHILFEAGENEGFERGADAILKALHERGKTGIPNQQGKRGVLVFIPDDEKGE